MQIVRTMLWIAVLLALVAFTFGNFDRASEVRIWPGLVWETRVPAIVIVSFLIGLVPTWLYHRGVKWSLNRRIRSLESAVKSNALARRHEPTAGAAEAQPTAQPGPAPDPQPSETPEALSPAPPVQPPKTDS